MAPSAGKKGPPKALPFLLALVLPLLYSVFVAPLFAASANPDDNMRALVVRVAIADTGDIGVAFSAFLNDLKHSHGLPSFHLVPPTTTYSELLDAVKSLDAYAAVYIEADATTNLVAALASSSSAQPVSSRIRFAWDESRNNLATSPRVGGVVRALLQKFCTGASAAVIQGLQASSPSLLSSAPPGLLVQPVAFTEEVVFPFTAPVATQALLVGNILLCVFSLVITNIMYTVLMPFLAGLPPVTLALKRLGLYTLYTGCVSAAYATILVALARENDTGGDFDGTAWARVWASAWLMMLVFALWLGLAATGAGSPAPAGVLLLPLIVFNVISLSTDLADPGFKIFWWAPMWHEAELVRNILFGTLRTRVGMHVGVLFAWLVLEVLLFVALHVRKGAAAKGAAPFASAEPPQSEGASAGKLAADEVDGAAGPAPVAAPAEGA